MFEVNFDTLFDVQTGFVAFLGYLWGNGAISRFIGRLNQFLLLFSFIVTFIVYVNHNRIRSFKVFLFSVLALFISYILSVIFLFKETT